MDERCESMIRLAEECAWDGLYEQACCGKAINRKECFTAQAPTGDSLLLIARGKLIGRSSFSPMEEENLRFGRPSLAGDALCQGVRQVFYDALNLGLIMAGKFDQSLGWGGSNGPYQFTTRGLKFFRDGEMSLSAPGLLLARIQEVVEQCGLGPDIAPLAQEAQKCWSLGCFRAAMVMIGLCVEDACVSLLDVLQDYPTEPTATASLRACLSKATDDSTQFYTRWQSGIQVLLAIKENLKKAYGKGKPQWWKEWELVPGAIEPYAQSVRFARNKAAHSLEDLFTSAQVGLLLASLPTMLEVISSLAVFLRTPPDGVNLPALG